MGLFSGLFGGPEKIQVMTDPQMALLGDQSRLLQGQLGKGIEGYGGQIAPGATGLQTQAFQAGGNLLGSPSQTTFAAQGAANRALSGQPSFQVDPAQSEAFYQSAVSAPATQQFQDSLRGLDARYGDRWSQNAGAHQASVMDANRRFQTDLSGQRAGLVFGDVQAQRQAMESGANRALQAIPAAGQFDATQRANIELTAGLGGQERGIEGQQLGEDYNKWLMTQPWANPWLGMIGQNLSAQPYAIANKQGALGAIGGAVGGIGQGIGAIMSGRQ